MDSGAINRMNWWWSKDCNLAHRTIAYDYWRNDWDYRARWMNKKFDNRNILSVHTIVLLGLISNVVHVLRVQISVDLVSSFIQEDSLTTRKKMCNRNAIGNKVCFETMYTAEKLKAGTGIIYANIYTLNLRVDWILCKSSYH